MCDTVKLLVVCDHSGRGSHCNITIYTRKDFIDFYTNNMEISDFDGVDEEIQSAIKKCEKIWDNDDELLTYHEQLSDYNIVMGIVHVTKNNKWLVLFDLDTPATYNNQIDIIDRNTDCDQYVRDHYFISMTDIDDDSNIDDDSGIIHQNIKMAWETPLEWDNEKSYYGVIKRQYCSEFWGWADGCREDEPFLGEGYTLIHGITRIDLDQLNLYDQF